MVTIAQLLTAIFEQADERAVNVAKAEKAEIVGADDSFLGGNSSVANAQKTSRRA
jgi:hypothetical protein